jgi:hypothetical protein
MVTQEAEKAPMQADDGSWYGGFATGIGFAAGFSAAFLALRSRMQSPAAPQVNQVELRQNPMSMALIEEEPIYTASPQMQTKFAGAHVAHMQASDRFSPEAGGNEWDQQGADWARNGGLFGALGKSNVIWAREAEIKHGRVCMLAALGSIVQDFYVFPFMKQWYNGEKMWGLHEAAIKSGALWQVLFFIGLLEVPFLLKCTKGGLTGDGDIGFDPLGLKKDPVFYARRQLQEVKNGRLAMIGIAGMTHHYFLTGKGPVQFLAQIPNFKSCTAAAIDTGLCR